MQETDLQFGQPEHQATPTFNQPNLIPEASIASSPPNPASVAPETSPSDASPVWPDPVDLQLLLTDLRSLLTRFVVLPNHAAETLSLWIVHTYVYELRSVSTYIGVESPEKRCGKTTLLSVLSELVSRPVVAANISSSALFRVIEELRPTLIIDEADTLLLGNDELRGILNCGYTRKTAYVVRVSNSPSTSTMHGSVTVQTRLARFSCWCPKIMAAIGSLPETLADRCIVIRMHRKLAGEQCQRLQSLQTAEIRACCARVALDLKDAIAEARPQIPKALNDRAADIWEPLLALAELAGGTWPEAARQAAVSLNASSEESNAIGILLLDIFAHFVTTKQSRVFSRDLVEHLNSLPLRPYAERRNAKGISELWLATKLRPYNVRPATIWIGDSAAKGYLQEDFMDVFRRYIPKSSLTELLPPKRDLSKDPEQLS